MVIIKKVIVMFLIAVGFILLLADSDSSFIYILTVKAIAFVMIFGGIQLCSLWHLFEGYLDE